MESQIVNPAEFSLMSPSELQAGIAALSRGAYFREASLDMLLGILTEAAAGMSGVARAGIWALCGDSNRRLVCLDLFERRGARHDKGLAIDEQDFPRYFQALMKGQPIVADDAFLHPVIGDFAGDYLHRFKVSAMLDMPIHIRGELQGVLRLEQVGARQPWSAAIQLFAQAVANLVTLALVEHEREEAWRQAQAAREALQAMRHVA